MNKNDIAKYAVLHALLATSYIAMVALFITNAEHLLPNMPNILGVILFLLLFSTSAAVMGIIVFARPILWYLDNRKKEAGLLLLSTITSMILIAVILFITLVIISGVNK